MRPVFIAFLLFFSNISHSSAGITDTIGKAEMQSFLKEYQTSTFHYYYLFDSFSKNGDIINASYYLEKVNPYYAICEWENNERPDTLLKHFNITKDEETKYIALYNKTLKSRKSAAYSDYGPTDHRP